MKKVNISFKIIAVILFLIFINLIIWYNLLPYFMNNNLMDSSYKSIIDMFPTFAIIVGVLLIICIFLIIFNKNISFEINKKTFKRYATFNNISGIIALFIFIIIVFSYNSFIKYSNEREYKDLVYSLNDNSDYDNRITKNNSTKDYKSLDSNMFLGYKIENNEVIDSYLCFIYAKKLTCLKHGKENFLNNKKKLEKVIGKENCYEYQNYYKCSYNNYSFNMNSNGSLTAMIEYNEDDKDYCYNQNNSFKCN